MMNQEVKFKSMSIYSNLDYSRMKKLILILLMLVMSEAKTQSISEDLEGKFMRFIENHPIETPVLHVGSRVVFTGDTLRISGMVTDLFFRPTDAISQVMKVSLVDTTGHALRTLNFKNQAGTFYGSWYIPHTTPTGSYFLVAHSAYMQNFEEDLRAITPVYIKNIWDPGTTQKFTNIQAKRTFSVYPEGGKLIHGHNQKILISAPQADATSGKIMSKSGKVISEFLFNEGFGVTFFTPDRKEDYFIQVSTLSGKTHRQAMDIERSGATFKVSKVGSRYFVNVLTTEASNQSLSMVLESGNRLQSILPVTFNDQGTATFVLPSSALQGHFHTAALLDEQWNVLAIRPFHTLPKTMTLSGPDTVKTDTQISYEFPAASGAASTFSMSIPDAFSSHTYLLTDMALHYAFAPISARVSAAGTLSIDDLLIYTTSWFNEKWNNILSESTPFSMTIPPELGIDLRGENETVLREGSWIHFHQWKNKMSYSLEIMDGRFNLPLTDFHDQQTFTYAVKDSTGGPIKTQVKFENLSINLPEIEYIEEPATDSLINKAVGLKRVMAQYQSETLLNRPSLYDQLTSDRVYDMTDYVILKSFQEVVVDILVGIGIRSVKGEKELRINDPVSGETFDYKPTLIINDHQVANDDMIWTIPPIYIDEIKVISSKEHLGDFEGLGVHGGILGIQLQDDAPEALIKNIIDQKIEVTGFLHSQKSPASDLPDFRNELINIAGKQNDWTVKSSNETGVYRALIQCLSTDGSVSIAEKKTVVILPPK